MASSRRTELAALPRPGPLDDARAAWDAGEYERLLRGLHGVRFERREDRVAAAVVQARALLAVGRPAEVPALIDAVRDDCRSADDMLLAQMLRGAALTRTDRAAEGAALLDAAADAALRVPARAAEVAYYRALGRWGTHRVAEAEEIVDAALPAATGVVRSRLLQLLGWIAVRRENYASAAHDFTAALEQLDAAPEVDVKGRASILHALAFIAAEVVDLRLGRLVRKEYETNRWSDDTRIERFQVLEHLSWLSLLAGDVERAWDERQLALTLTVDTSYHAIALTHAAKIAGMVGDRFSESRYVELAGALLLRGDQLALDVERRTALLGFATAAREAHVELAQRVLTLYDRSHPRRTAMLAFEGDRRIEALELYARGRVALLSGEVKRGVAALQQSLDLWTRLNYRLRTAITANELRLATGDARYAAIALEALRDAPQAWLRPALEQRGDDDLPIAKLTPAERRVLAAVCKGKKAREIAADFGRSFNTINNHTRAIFTAFGVRNRAELVAECARLGLLDQFAS
jgi:DNA-binding CsgD family transcriptional regulator